MISLLSIFFFRIGVTLIPSVCILQIHDSNSLIRICGVDNNSFLGFIVNHEVGIVVTTALPCDKVSYKFVVGLLTGTTGEACLHIGIDWICILRIE